MRPLQRAIAALHTLAEAFPADHRMVITSKTNLGLYLCPAGKLQRAEILLRDAIQTARRALPGSAELGQALHNFALMCRNNNRWTEAEEAYAEAITILSNASGPAVTVTLRDEGIMWSLRGDAARARQSFARARTEVQARMPAESAAPVLRQLELDVASLAAPRGTAGAAAPAAAAPASSAGDAGGRVRESRMTR